MIRNNEPLKTAVIIGAGPAGLTAAYELLQRAPHIKPIIFEVNDYFGGIARTVNYKGNRIDIGGHRFFSKSDRVLQWWQKILPLEKTEDGSEITLTYWNKNNTIRTSSGGIDAATTEKVMLIRNRLSRIFFQGKFFEYPVTLNINTIRNLGLRRMLKIGLSYVYARTFPRREMSLEDFFINRFGNELYKIFFKDYTEKVWGIACSQMPADWGGQRVKNLSIGKVLIHMFRQLFSPKDNHKNVETSLIQKFLYPKYGPGQMWEEVAKIVQFKGGEISLRHKVVGLKIRENKIVEVKVEDLQTGEVKTQCADYVLSTMPIKDLICSMEPKAPRDVFNVAQGLEYRDFITVGLLMRKLNNQNIALDNWIYIQEKDVKVGRLQIFNNWSPYLVKDPETIWIGLEYFCNEGDALWNKEDTVFLQFAINELTSIGIINKEDVLDGTVIRMPKAYPSYTGTYNQFNLIRDFTDTIENLFLIGRNGMHKYNNQDHSMLAAMKAVDNIIANKTSKHNIWEVNADDDYHESAS